MKSFKVALIISILCTLTVGCAMKPAYVDPPKNEAGYVVGTIGKQTTGVFYSPHHWNDIYIRRLGSEENTIVSYKDSVFFGPKDGEIKEDDKSYDSFSVALLPGKYEIFKVSFYLQSGNAGMTYASQTDFSIPFNIKKGESTYIGEFTSFGTKGKNAFGLNVSNGGFFEYGGDKSERDLPTIFSKHPKVSKIVNKKIFDNLPNEYILSSSAAKKFLKSLEAAR